MPRGAAPWLPPIAAVAVFFFICLGVPARAASLQAHTDAAANEPAQGAQAPEQSPQHQSGEGAKAAGAEARDAVQEHGEEHAEGSIWGTVGRIFNFAVLAGALVYLLRSPFIAYLRARAVTIRADLKKAAELRDAASHQLAEIEARMRALPGEIATLTRRGAEEIAAEEARILAAAEAERSRMLEQARREIDLQVRLAERTLRRRAGELAVDVATERVRRAIDDVDQARLVDRYLTQVQPRIPSESGGLPS